MIFVILNYFTEVAKLHIDKSEICAYYSLCCVIHWKTLNVGLETSVLRFRFKIFCSV